MSIEAMSACWGEDFPTDCQGLSAPAIRVVALAIADVVNDTYRYEFFGSLQRLGTKVGLHRDTVRQVVAHLVREHVIEVVSTQSGGVTRYRWLWKVGDHAGMPRGVPRGNAADPRGNGAGYPAGRAATVYQEKTEVTPTPPSPLRRRGARLVADLTAVERADDFEAWWRTYPRKAAKQDAVRSWRTMFDAGHLPSLEVLCGSAKQLAERVQREHGEGWERFMPYPATWLNGRRWLDDDFAPIRRRAAWVAGADCEWCGGDGWRSVEGEINTMEPCPCRRQDDA